MSVIENVTNSSAVRVKLRQFISEREDELLVDDESNNVTDSQELRGSRNGAFDRFNNIFNISLDRSHRSCDNLDEQAKNGLLGRYALDLNRRSTSDFDDSDSSLWVFSKSTVKDENEGNKRGSFFKSWRKESFDTNDSTADLTSSIPRRSSNASLGSLTSLASEIGESRRKDLFDDFFETQLKKFAASDDSLLDPLAECDSKQNRRVSIDLNERPVLYTSRTTIKFDSSPSQLENDEQSQHDDRSDDEDDDRSNKGAFEFPSASRRIYLARSSFGGGSSCDLPSPIDKEHLISMNTPVIDNTSSTDISHLRKSERSIASEYVSSLLPRPVRKRMSWNLFGPKSGGSTDKVELNEAVMPSSTALAADLLQHHELSHSSDGFVFKSQEGSSQDYLNRVSRTFKNESRQSEMDSITNEGYNDSMSTLTDQSISDKFEAGHLEASHNHDELDFVKLLESYAKEGEQEPPTNSLNKVVNIQRQETSSRQISTFQRESPTSANFASDDISCGSNESDIAVIWPH